MTAAAPWLRVALAVAVYLVAAVAASGLMKRTGTNHKEMASRTGRTTAVVGMVTNLVVLGLILALVVFVDRRPLGDLGLGIGARDVTVIVVSFALFAALAAIYLLRLRATGPSQVTRKRLPAGQSPDVAGAVLVVLVLVAVALQEEVLFRGYVAVNLMRYGYEDENHQNGPGHIGRLPRG